MADQIRPAATRGKGPDGVRTPRLPTIAIVFSQFAPYHIDRIEAVAERLAGRAQVLAVEVASASHTYRWHVSGKVRGADKTTLFPGARVEDKGVAAKLRALWPAVKDCDWVLIGVPYSDPAMIALSWRLRAAGKRVVLMSESKRDDTRRDWWREAGKRILLSCYDAAIVGGPRQISYMRDLGFGGRPVLTGYDTVSVARLRSLAGETCLAWRTRPFVYVGRFVPKKNLFVLLEAYARYAGRHGRDARRLVMAGDGPLLADLKGMAARLDVAERVEWPGFLDAQATAEVMRRALALMLVSVEEQWGLVVNEAAALGVPVIVSRNVGARETLVRHLQTGLIVPVPDVAGIASAMDLLNTDEARWLAMRDASRDLALMGDVRHFADAVEKLIAPAPPPV